MGKLSWNSDKSIAKNASWIVGINIIQSILTLIINFFASRYLGPSNYGLISYAASIVAFATPVMQLGISSIIVNDLVNDKKNEGTIIGTAIVLNFLSALICIIGIFFITYLTSKNDQETVYVCTLYSISLAFQAVCIVEYWFQANLLSKYSSIASFFAYCVMSAYKIFLLKQNKGIRWFAFSNVLNFLIISVILILFYTKLGGKKFSFSQTVAHKLILNGRYYIVSGMMVTIFAQTDRIMIKHMLSNAEVGYYSVAVTCAGMASFVFSAIIDSYRPTILKMKSYCEAQFENSIVKLYNIVTYFALIQCICMTLFSSQIINILYGKAYAPAASALKIIVWYTTFSYYGAVRNIWILAEGKHNILWIINLSGAAINIALNFIFIKKFGINGASLASLLTQFFTNFVMGFFIPSIRKNNLLMIRGLNPYILIDSFSRFKKLN